MGENFKIHLQGTADTKQWAAANGLLGKLTGSADKFVESIRAGVGIDLGGKLVNSLASLPGVFADILKGGIEFNRSMESAEIGIASVLGKFQGLSKEAARNAAADAIKAIAREEPRAAATMDQLVEGFLSTVSTAQSVGIAVEDNIKLVGDFSNVLSNLNIPAQQLSQELRSILSGNIGADSTVAKILQISNEDIAKAREAGKLLEFLQGKIAGLEEAGDSADVVFSTLASAIQKLQGVLAKPLFARIVQGSKDMMAVLDNPEVLKTLTAIGVEIGAIVDTGTDLAKWAIANAEGIRTLFYWSKEAFMSLTGLRSVLAVMGAVSKQAPETPKAPASTGTAEAVPGTTGNTPLGPMYGPQNRPSEPSGGGGSGSGGSRSDASRAGADRDEQNIQDNEDLRNMAAKTAKANAEVRADAVKLELAREAEKTEVAITAAKAAGQDVVAKQLEDQTRINDLARKYRDELKMTAADALSLAQTKVQSERSIADQNNAETGGGSGTDLDRLIERAKESAKRKKDRYKYSLANPDQDVSSIDQIKNNTIFQGEFYNNRGGGEATATRPDRGLDVNRVNSLGNPNSSGNILDGLRKKDTGSPLTDQSPLTPGGGLADFKGAEKGVQSPGSANSGTVNLGPNKAAQTAKEAADGMGRVVTAVTQRDAALAGELSRLKSQVATLENRISETARTVANNRT